MDELKTKLFIIDDGKSVYADNAYREVVLERGGELVDIVYNKGAFRAKHDMEHIKSELVTYGFESAFVLAEQIRDMQKNWEQNLNKE